MCKTRALWRTPPKSTLEERLLLTSLFCVSIINYLVFLVWSEVSHYFTIIGVVVQHLLIPNTSYDSAKTQNLLSVHN